MDKSKKQITDELREQWLRQIATDLAQQDVDVLQTATNTLYIPCVDSAGEDRWVRIVIQIPTVKDECDDGYALAQEYQIKVSAKADKEKEKE